MARIPKARKYRRRRIPTYYRVKPKETLSTISYKFFRTTKKVKYLARINGIKNIHQVRQGRRIRLVPWKRRKIRKEYWIKINLEKIIKANKHLKHLRWYTQPFLPLNKLVKSPNAIISKRRFGYHRDPFTRKRAFHYGVDIGTRRGTSIYNRPVAAANSGLVIYACVNKRVRLGNFIMIYHKNGNNAFVSIYGHLKKVSVKKGDIVSRGQIVGTIGTSGRSTGPHLHFGLLDKNGIFRNPLILARLKILLPEQQNNIKLAQNKKIYLQEFPQYNKLQKDLEKLNKLTEKFVKKQIKNSILAKKIAADNKNISLEIKFPPPIINETITVGEEKEK